MEPRKRSVIAAIWVAVAVLIGVTFVDVSSTTDYLIRFVAMGLALFLAGVYAFDPWGVVSRGPLESMD